MKLRIFLVCLFLTSTSLFSENIPHLILYFDVNKTLIASDKAGNKSVEDVLNELLSEKYLACWDKTIQEPMTFEAYVSQILVPGSEENVELRMQRKFYRQHFISYLYERNHPLYGPVLQEYEKAISVLNNSASIIFPSFYSLLSDLDSQGISYTIILRSFGEEVFDVKNEISAMSKIIFNRTGIFREGKLYLENESLEDPYEIYHLLRRIGHIAIQDDWNYWNAHRMSAEYGKPFYIDKEDNDTLPIFFDDNINNTNSANNIIAPLDPSRGVFISMGELIESRQAVQVDTLQAILKDDYFINCVRAAIHHYNFLKDFQRL